MTRQEQEAKDKLDQIKSICVNTCRDVSEKILEVDRSINLLQDKADEADNLPVNLLKKIQRIIEEELTVLELHKISLQNYICDVECIIEDVVSGNVRNSTKALLVRLHKDFCNDAKLEKTALEKLMTEIAIIVRHL